MTDKIRRSAAIAIAVLLLILLLAGTGTAAWGTPEQDPLRATIPTVIPGDHPIFIPFSAKNAGPLGMGGPSGRP